MDDRITTYFITYFLSLILYRLLEEKYTCSEIIEAIRNRKLNKIAEIGYIPIYTRSDITDKFNFRADNEITKIVK